MSTLTDAISTGACYVRCGMPLRTLSWFGSSELPHAAFNSDGSRVVTASYGGTARVWDAANGAVIGESLQKDDAVESAEFSPGGKRVVTASAARGVSVLLLQKDVPEGVDAASHRSEIRSGIANQ